MKHDSMVANASDPKQVKAAEKKERNVREQELFDMKSVLATDAGRRVMWRILCHCQIFGGDVSTVNHAEAHKILSRQSVGRYVMSEVEQSDQDALFKMMKEAKHQNQERRNV